MTARPSSFFYPGRRISYDGMLCTVRYYGPLAGTKGDWLGVEWDDPSRGKHDGRYQGERMFSCLSPATTAASFLRPTRKADPEVNVLEAIRAKYDSSSLKDSSSGADLVVISGKVAEEVGFDKIAKELSELAELRIVLVDQLAVNGTAHRGATSTELFSAQEDLRKTCPNITELDLGYNVIEDWQAIADTCAALPRLKVLKAGGLRLRAFQHSLKPSPLAQTKELHLEECLLSPAQVCDLLSDVSGFPNLEQLYLSGNHFDVFNLAPSSPTLDRLESLVLDNNAFTDLQCLVSITKLFPRLKSLSLQGNVISEVGHTLRTSVASFSHIETLNVSHNQIRSYQFVDALPQLLPNLQSLRISNNPLYNFKEEHTVHDPRASDKSYYLTLARIPKLKTLNYANISSRDREEGEIYYLSVAGKELKTLYANGCDMTRFAAEADVSHPRYRQLVTKYDRDSVIDQLMSSYEDDGDTKHSAQTIAREIVHPPGSLGARLVTATFHLSKTSYQTTMVIPSSIPVTRLMAMLLHNPAFEQRLKPLQFNLIYESQELDPVDSTTESSTRSVVYGRNLTVEAKTTLWKEWGDWDADAMVADALRNGIAGVQDDVPSTSQAAEEYWTEDGEFCIKEGRKWKRREITIPQSLKRPWGDWIENSKTARIRIEPS